jgi:hypothetical protein
VVQVNLAVSTSLAGNYVITIMGTNTTVTHQVQLSVTVIDFTISTSQQTIGPLNPGTSGTSTITITFQHNFVGTITLTVNAPAAVTSGINPSSLSNQGAAILTVSSTTPGNYTITVTGTSTSSDGFKLLRTTGSITLVVEDFSITPTSTSLTFTQGTTVTDTIQLTNLGQIKASISLSTSLDTPGPAISLSSASVNLTPSGTGTSDLTINTGVATPATYTITVTATLGSTRHTGTITLVIVQPTIKFVSVTGIPTTSISTGHVITVNVDVSNPTLVALNFNITLNVGSITVDMKQLTLAPSQDSGTITLKWDTTSYTAGDYSLGVGIVDVTTTGPNPISLTATTQNAPSASTVTLTSSQGGPSFPGGTGGLIVVIAVVVGAAALATILLLRRRSAVTKTQ